MTTKQEMNERIDDETPCFVRSGLDIESVRAIQHGGCASGAYMPAVTYHKALETMSEHGDAVFDYLEEAYGETPEPDEDDKRSWAGMACFYLSAAVEAWASTFDLDEIDGPLCAIGCLIPDSEYNPLIEGLGSMDLVERDRYRIPSLAGLDHKLLAEMQYVHDSLIRGPALWEDEFSRVAEKFGLEVPQ